MMKRADIEPVATQHVTLWGTKEARQAYLPDIKKLESSIRMGGTIRCGLDRRSTHFVLSRTMRSTRLGARVAFDLLGT